MFNVDLAVNGYILTVSRPDDRDSIRDHMVYVFENQRNMLDFMESVLAVKGSY